MLYFPFKHNTLYQTVPLVTLARLDKGLYCVKEKWAFIYLVLELRNSAKTF